MAMIMQFLLSTLLVISAGVLLLLPVHGQSGDALTPNTSITNGQTLISAGGVFELGFFVPDGSADHYIGIWFKNISERTVVWVANREAPLSGSNSSSGNNSIGVLKLSTDGNLALVNSTGHAVWSTNTSNVVGPVVRLLDTGNLVLTAGGGGDPGSALWQSFDHPCDTMLAGMKIGLDLRDNIDRYLSSWKSPSDPSPGSYSYRMERHGVPEIFTLEKDTPVYRVGPWTGVGFANRPNTNKNGLFSFHFTMNENEVDYSYTVQNESILSRVVLNEDDGAIVRLVWSATTGKWTKFWAFPEGDCDHYATCGANGVCSTFYTLSCDCMTGFAPRSAGEWSVKQFSGGCARNVQLNCSTDGFYELQNMKLPDTQNATMSRNETLDGCKERCRGNCSCAAYAVTEESACFMWFGDLADLRSFTDGGEDVYIRLAKSEIDALSRHHSSNKKRLAIILLPVVIGMLLLVSLGLLLSLKMRKRRQRGSVARFNTNRTKGDDELDLPLFDMMTIKNATKEFSTSNIIGQGGFGPVYKGQLDDGREIAVKRLSENSAQGLDEFKTEVLLIANLQHRNLVRLLGCCVEEDERMLIYEYMENKSLDAFIFDETKSTLLDWQKRIDIITGIARGLVYMHHDSRLKIVHRDLKTNNILLDREMNPRISDFGTARIVKINDEKEGNCTNRVIGTCGYMSPEYAMDGIFSTKSDVYGFGVITLEIISGKNNGALSRDDRRSSLVGHAWRLWKEGRSLELVDVALAGSTYPVAEVLRCIQVGLLCVQEGSDDRPTMAEVVLMLSSKDVALHEPNEPGFSKPSTSLAQTSYYSDETPLTVVVGR